MSGWGIPESRNLGVEGSVGEFEWRGIGRTLEREDERVE